MEKYTQPSAYFPDFDHGSCLLAATSPGGLLLVILTLIRFTRSWRDSVGVFRGKWDRRKGMVADVRAFELYRVSGCGRSIRNLPIAIIQVLHCVSKEAECASSTGGQEGVFQWTNARSYGYISWRRLPRSSVRFYDGVSC